MPTNTIVAMSFCGMRFARVRTAHLFGWRCAIIRPIRKSETNPEPPEKCSTKTFLCHERVYQQDDGLAVENQQDHGENLELDQQSRCRRHVLFEPRRSPQSIFGLQPQRFAQQQSRRAQPVHEKVGASAVRATSGSIRGVRAEAKCSGPIFLFSGALLSVFSRVSLSSFFRDLVHPQNSINKKLLILRP